MNQDRNRSSGQGLERSCKSHVVDWLRSTEPDQGVEFLQAWFAGRGYRKHRHDTYAICLTDSGVQAFEYRGVLERSCPGQILVLHPDEPHDGYAGTEEGFGYRSIYVEPVRIGEAVQTIAGRPRSLPFVREAVSNNAKLSAAVNSAFQHHREPLAIDGLILRLAEGLLDADTGGEPVPNCGRLDQIAVKRARQFLDARTNRVVRSHELVVAVGLSRFELARQFRSAYGTSPYRYSLMRRLKAARQRIQKDQSLATTALATGFSDQAHFTRMFKAAFGLTPARYRTTLRGASC